MHLIQSFELYGKEETVEEHPVGVGSGFPPPVLSTPLAGISLPIALIKLSDLPLDPFGQPPVLCIAITKLELKSKTGDPELPPSVSAK